MEKVHNGDPSVMRSVANVLVAFSPSFRLDITKETDLEWKRNKKERTKSVSTIHSNVIEEEESKPELPKSPFPDLMSSDPLLDSRQTLSIPPTATNPFHNTVTIRNHRSIFHEAMALDNFDFSTLTPTKSDLVEEELTIPEKTPLPLSPFFSSESNMENLFKFILSRRIISQQTGKGKIKHYQVFAVVGDGDGLVGMGMGTSLEVPAAQTSAYVNALKNMDYVSRYEGRTIWTPIRSKYRSTQIDMRPRPMGFGLRCQPVLHQILKAAGIKDISAKVRGSRNPVMIMQGTLKMLHGGWNPLGLGDGIGGKGKRQEKGVGMRGKDVLERERGRRVVDFRK
ncbi:hypothetical protein BDP27DRAFT_1365076 [Rhodocollybia butyracea]|uniref:S5 DRBM domain-containing protein n=1 Tax=Rhodocollybia butyracea TaxID=206335 RepID=A0A9P5PSM3_9AGAR|nr:hypothetical protein BDP27DRAFT_1365076 [Rhodocollybia butyracea]